MNGAEWLVQSMVKQGIKNIFGYPGGAIMPIYDALYGSELEHILCRHEQGAAIAAIGYARSSGAVGVCMATSGPGATNLITGLSDAMLDSVPIVAITGQVASAFIGSDAFQEMDIIGISLGCTKHSFLVESIEMLPFIVEQAFFIAANGRPGPVLIDIPKDIQLAHTTATVTKWQNKQSFPAIHPKKIEQANLLLEQAKYPILYIGGGVQIAKAMAPLRELIAKSGIPSVETLKALGTVDYSDRYYLGMLGMHGSKAANLAVQHSDLLIVIGARFDDRVTGKLSSFAPNAKVIQLDIDQAELGKLRHVDVGILGDIKQIIPLLNRKSTSIEWRDTITQLKKKHLELTAVPDKNRISAPHLLTRLSLETVNTQSIFTTDVGQHQMWAAQHIKVKEPYHFITSSGLGTMGFGLPVAIGAKIARPDHAVICITGDGSFMMNIQELNTIKRYGLPIKIVLFDNQRLGMVRQWQQLFFEQRYSETELNDNPDFVLLASAFNIESKMITQSHEVAEALDIMLASDNAYLLHVKIDPFENVWPLVPPGVANQMMLDGTVINDE